MDKDKKDITELHDLKQAVDELSFLNKLSHTISSTLSVQEIMATIINSSIKAIGVEQGTIMLLEEKSKSSFKTFIRGFDEKNHGKIYKLGDYLFGWMIENQRPLLVNDTSNDEHVKGLEAKESGISSLLSVPLLFRGQLIGSINLYNKKNENRFSENDQRLMSIIASQVASFLINARSFEQVQETKNILQKQTINLQKEVGSGYELDNFIGESAEILVILDKIKSCADSVATVLITGETGTGKELVAKMIHYNSDRKDKIFIDVNAAAIPDNLMESEFFGIEEGVATGVKKRIGLFEQAEGGTVFIDEIGDMSMLSQAKILRFLEEHKIRRVGSNHNIDIDVRVIVATNKNLKENSLNNKFREDLYYRLCILEIQLPPLRERRDDILLLVDHFLQRFSKKSGKVVNGFTEEAEKALVNYDWPGNIRELANVVERSVIMTKKPDIGLEYLTPEIKPVDGSLFNSGNSYDEALTNLKIHLITKALRNRNNKAEAARHLKISKGYLFRLLKQLEIK